MNTEKYKETHIHKNIDESKDCRTCQMAMPQEAVRKIEPLPELLDLINALKVDMDYDMGQEAIRLTLWNKVNEIIDHLNSK